MPSAIATTIGSSNAGGHAAVVSATSALVPITARHHRRTGESGRYPPRRKSPETIIGVSAYKTRAPKRPAASALRGTGLMPYASAAATAALPGPVIRRPRRHAPNTPNGNAPTTTIVRAMPVAPSSSVPRIENTPSWVGAGADEPRST